MKPLGLFARFKIGTRVYAGFAITLALLAALGSFGAFAMRDADSTFDFFNLISNNTTKSAEIDAGFGTVRRTAFTYAVTGKEQPLTQARDNISRVQQNIVDIVKVMSVERKTMMESVGKLVDAYAANFEIGVKERVARDKAFDGLATTGVKATNAVGEIVKTAMADEDFAVAAFAGRVEAAMLLVRINAARFVGSPDSAMADTFRNNYGIYRTAITELGERLKSPERKRLASEAAAAGAAYARTFDDYVALTLALDKLFYDTMAKQGVTIEAMLADIVKAQRGVLTTLGTQIDEHLGSTATTMITIAIGALVFGILIAFLISRSIVKPVSGLTAGMKELADGNFEVILPGLGRQDEVGDMAQAVETFKVKLAEKARREAEEKAAAERQAAEAKRLADEREAGLQRTAEEKAAADRKAAMHRLADDFENAVGGIIDNVSSASTELEVAANTLSKTAETTQQLSTLVASASEEASANVQSVASATEEMSGSVGEISRQVQESSNIAGQAVRQAQSTDTSINELSQAASRIGDVVKLITSVAEQTNLLALNATIEAARAGMAGKGFAVVASEVKALAAQTAKATGEISAQIAGMQSATRVSVVAIKEIGGTITRISEIAQTIAAAVEEQGAATQEISRNVQEAAKGTAQVASNIVSVNEGAGETGAASSQVLSSAQSLATESNRLKIEVQKFLQMVRAA